jgi:hypothetical protein
MGKIQAGVFNNRVLTAISGHEKNEITGDWRKLHNEELHDLYSLPDIIGNETEKDDTGKAYCTCGGEKVHIRFLWGNTKKKDNLEDQALMGGY